MKTKIIILLSLNFAFACDTPFQGKNSPDSTTTDIKKIIPKSKRGIPYSYYTNKKYIENKISLNSLESGVDSFEIRVLYNYSSSDSSYMLVIKKGKREWIAELINFSYIISNSGDSITGIRKNSQRSLVLKADWLTLSRVIEEMGIETLPSDSEILNYPDNTDGSGVVIEVANFNSYKIYSYWELRSAQKTIKEARTVTQFLDLLDNQFELMIGKNM